MAMKVDKHINKFLSKVFGPEDSQGNRPVWFHSQNLNEDRQGKVKGWPIEGRCWLNSAKRGHRTVFSLSWHLWSKFCGVGIKSDSEDGGTQFHWAFPPVSIWMTLPIPMQKWLQRPFWKKWNEETGGYTDSHRYTSLELFDLRIHDNAIWWAFLKFDWGWSSQMPKWMSGCWRPLDTFFGRTEYTKKEMKPVETFIPMPEGKYPATIVMQDCTWKRPRLPWASHRGTYADVKLHIPIPHEGKGENSWDCGKDGLYGSHCQAKNIEDAIASVVASALQSRRKYDGDVNAVYPDPATYVPPTPPKQGPPPEAQA